MNDNFYKQLIEESLIGYAYHKIICDGEGISCDYEFIEVNAAFEKLTGLRGSDIVGRRVTEILPGIRTSEFDWIHFYGDIAINGGKKEFEQFSEPLNKWYKVNIYSPEKYYFIAHFIDTSKEIVQLTELKNLQEICKETELKYKTVVDYAYDWETWEDGAGKLKYVSPACERISGYTVDEFVENDSLFALIIVEEDKEIWLNHRHEIGIEIGVRSEQFHIINKDGKIVSIEHTCRPVIDKKGMYLGYRANNRDITDRKMMEESLKKSEEGYRLIFENAVEAIVVIQNREIQICNPMAQRLTGYSEKELTSMPFLDLIYCEDVENAKDIYNPRLKEESCNYKHIYRLIRKDKEIRWVESNGIKINWNGKEAVLSFVIDITERKNAEEELGKWKYIIMHAEWGVAVANANKQVFELMNPEFARMHGYIIEELIELPFFAVIAPEVLETLPAQIRFAHEHGHNTYESIHIRKDGSRFPVILDVTAVKDQGGNVLYRIISVLDITERKKLEIALSNEKKLLETTLISVGDGVISTDNKGNIVFLNRAAEFLTGWTQETARGKPIEEVFNIVNEFTREKGENIVKKILESGKINELTNHILLISKDGIERPIEDSAAPIVQDNGEIVGIVLVFRDFSEKKQKLKEIEFLSYHDQLTGLYNRRYYEEELKRLDTERNLPLTLIMGDVNGLKLINDFFGHVVGDELLKKVAEVIKKVCRTDDIIARIGGDEFVIILPKTDAFETEKIIERIKGLAINEKAGSIDISISFGYETKKYKEENIQEIFKYAEDHMYRHKLSESSRMRRKTIDLIMNTLYEKNNRERLHSIRVSEVCETIATKMDFDNDDVSQIRIAGLMHDIGKMEIDGKILNKSQGLNKDEWEEIKRHPEIGYRILSSVNEFSEIADYVLEHQERWDGKGYPRGLKGEEILLQARIIAIADAFDAMTTNRSYGKALSEEEATNEIRRCSGAQFDPTIARVFIEKVLRKEWE